MSSADRELVVIAISGRALAQSAQRGGYRVRVLDVFADCDTQAAGEARSIARGHSFALDPELMFAALGETSHRSQTDLGPLLLPGSGFERDPQWLEELAGFGTLAGNDADLVRAFKEPLLFEQMMQALGFDVPETRLDPPADARGWLQKEIGAAGGLHIRPAAGAKHASNRYYQRVAAGKPLSVAFLADGERAYVLGYNAQAIAALGASPYCYVGAATCELSGALRAEMQRQLDRLVRVSGLRGLNGLDFLLDGESVHVIEVNPRPTATFELYEPEIEGGLVRWHVASCAGSVPQFADVLNGRPRAARAYRILFAQKALRVPQQVQYPEWWRDRPQPGSTIALGAPVLSVFAEGADSAAVETLLAQRLGEAAREVSQWTAREGARAAGAVAT
jgi:predicted ATP-grasp superfamily ATP-dependent carboligase